MPQGLDRHNEAVQELPYAAAGSPRWIEGKQGLAKYLKDYHEKLDLPWIGRPVWHYDGNTAIVEFEVEGTAVPTGEPYDQRDISAIEHLDGLIMRDVDHWKPRIVAEALGGAYRQGADMVECRPGDYAWNVSIALALGRAFHLRKLNLRDADRSNEAGAT